MREVLPAFMFQEGANAKVEATFREVARLTRGAYAAFDANAAGTLAELLRAVAIYASGGAKALADHAKGAGQLVRQIASLAPADGAAIGLPISAYMLSFALFTPFAGRWAERYGVACTFAASISAFSRSISVFIWTL